jgi:hypothetical protein
MTTIYNKKDVKQNFMQRSNHPTGKFLVGFSNEIIGFTTSDQPCIIVKILGHPTVISQKDPKEENIFMSDAFVKEIDDILMKVCETTRETNKQTI